MWRFVNFLLESSLFWKVGASLCWLIVLFRPSARWHVLCGYCREQARQYERARESYVKATILARDTKSANELRWFHPAQFFLERIRTQLGDTRVFDPLFSASIVPSNSEEDRSRWASGFYRAEFVYSGLRIMGIVGGYRGDYVSVYLGDAILRSVSVRRGPVGSAFTMMVFRPALDTFPMTDELTVATEDGRVVPFRGYAAKAVLNTPSGDGTLVSRLSRGAKLSKKGTLSPPAEEIRAHQDAYLELYARARDLFDSSIGKPLFIFYGTLLGYYRENDFITDDDDFDAGYISDATDPVSVKNETKEIIKTLLMHGFTVSFNSRGRLFRIQSSDSEAGGVHIDARPLWFQDGRVWAHNHFAMPASIDDYLPIGVGALRGTLVYTPRNIEKFLVGQYGEGWSVPDPGFVYHRDAIDRWILENLNQALITPEEFRQWQSEFDATRQSNPRMGRFISLAMADMYPLDQTDLEFE